jgi:CRISPR-associated protein Csb1
MRLDSSRLAAAVREDSAIRFDLELQPPGGPIHKVFPPTYPSPREAGRADKRAAYATEPRIIGDQQVTAVLLDSVPAQANRLEQALLSAHRADHDPLPLPHLEVFVPGYGTVTDLDAPHRVYDAILLDSKLEDKPFLQSRLGSQLGAASPSNATTLFTYAPTALLFGAWNSHAGQRVGA